jgi:predicted DNA-binding protein
MPSKNLGINIVLEDVTYDALKSLSDTKGLSMAQMVAEMVKDSLELREDLFLADIAEKRENSRTGNLLTHYEVVGRRA